jgi:putative ABC transport system permease protein
MINEWHLVLEYVGRRKFRTALTTLAIVFGVAVIFAVRLLVPGLINLLEGSVAGGGASDLRVQSAAGAAFDPAIVGAVAGIDGVKAAAGVLRREVSLPLPDGTTAAVEMIGIDPAAQEKVNPIALRDGRFLEQSDSGRIVLPAGVADPAGMDVGDAFPLLTIEGLKDFTVAGVYDDRGMSLTPAVYLLLPDAQAVFGLPGRINAVDVLLATGADREAVAGSIRTALGSSYRIGAAPVLDIAFVGTLFNLFGAMALFIGGFLIFNTFRTVVAERRREIGLLRAIGADRPQILRMILMESGLQGVIGTALGLLAGYPFGFLLANAVSAAAFRGASIDVSLTAESLFLPAALGIGTTLLAGFLPARTASRIPPLAALQPAVPESGCASLPAGIVGLLCLAAGVVLMLSGEKTVAPGSLAVLVGAVLLTPLLVGPAVRLFTPLIHALFPDVGSVALSNVVRQPGRTAVTVNTLMVGAAVLVATTAMVATERDSLMREFDIMLGADTSTFTVMPAVAEAGPSTFTNLSGKFGAGEGLAASLAAVPGVETVVSVRAAQSLHADTVIPLVGIDPERFPDVRRYDFLETEPGDPYAALQSGRAVFVNPYLRDHLHLGLGDSLTLETLQGLQAYRIVAVLDDYTSGTGTNYVVLSQQNLARDFGVAEDAQLLIRLAPGAAPDGTRPALESILKEYPQFRLVDSAAYQLAIRDSFNAGLSVFDVMLLAVLLPALLGLLNTLAINILERTTEIGLLRAVGTDRGMIRRMILGESLMLNVLGAVIGLAVGAALSGTFIGVLQEITPGDHSVFPLGMIAAYMLVFLALALLISLIPARNAARLNIVQALQSE